MDDIKAHIEQIKNGELKEESTMSPAVRTTIKVVTAVLFLVLVAVVVLGTDRIMEWFKGLFGG